MQFDFAINAGSAPPIDAELSFIASGEEPAEGLTGVQIHIHQITPLRDNWTLSKSIGNLPNFGVTSIVNIDGLGPGLYVISSVTSNGSGPNMPPINHRVSGNVYFDVPNTLTAAEARNQVETIHEKRKSIVTKILVSDNASEESPLFAVIIYFSGVDLHIPFLLEGAEVYPVEGSVGIDGLEQPLTVNPGDKMTTGMVG